MDSELNKRVHGEVLAVYTDGHDRVVSDLDFHVQRIIAIVREEILQPETITAAHKGVPPPVQIERVLTNALNEVFGE